MMKKFFALSMFLHKAALLLLAAIFLVFFLATGHGVNLSDTEQMRFFLFQILFVVTFTMLVMFKRNKEIKLQRTIYTATIICLFAVLIVMTQILVDIFAVKYGENKPYFIFLILFWGIGNNLFLLFIFLFRRDVLFQEPLEEQQ